MTIKSESIRYNFHHHRFENDRNVEMGLVNTQPYIFHPGQIEEFLPIYGISSEMRDLWHQNYLPLKDIQKEKSPQMRGFVKWLERLLLPHEFQELIFFTRVAVLMDLHHKVENFVAHTHEKVAAVYGANEEGHYFFVSSVFPTYLFQSRNLILPYQVNEFNRSGTYYPLISEWLDQNPSNCQWLIKSKPRQVTEVRGNEIHIDGVMYCSIPNTSILNEEARLWMGAWLPFNRIVRPIKEKNKIQFPYGSLKKKVA